jgi:hypothetical protein
MYKEIHFFQINFESEQDSEPNRRNVKKSIKFTTEVYTIRTYHMQQNVLLLKIKPNIKLIDS